MGLTTTLPRAVAAAPLPWPPSLYVAYPLCESSRLRPLTGCQRKPHRVRRVRGQVHSLWEVHPHNWGPRPHCPPRKVQGAQKSNCSRCTLYGQCQNSRTIGADQRRRNAALGPPGVRARMLWWGSEDDQPIQSSTGSTVTNNHFNSLSEAHPQQLRRCSHTRASYPVLSVH